MANHSLQSVRRHHLMAVLHRIREQPGISRAQLARRLHLSRPAVSELVSQLLADGLVKENGTENASSQGGRRPTNLVFDPSAGYVLGIDIGATKTLIVLSDLEGAIQQHYRFDSHAHDSDHLTHILHHVKRFMAQVEHFNIIGTGIGLPTAVDPHSGVITIPPGLPVNTNDLRVQLSKCLPAPMIIENDVNMAVLGEQWKGAARGLSNVVMVSIGTGIGAGILLNGQLYRGAKGFAGEIGYFQFDPAHQSPVSSVTEYGALEQIASGNGIVSRATQLLPRFPASVLHQGSRTTQAVFDAAKAHDPLATQLIQEALIHLSLAVSQVISLLDLDMVILGGGVLKAGDFIVSEIVRQVQSATPLSCKVVKADLGDQAEAIGAVARVLLETELIPQGFSGGLST